jgi:RNA polymerase sigma-70 factor (ECF subfamily)
MRADDDTTELLSRVGTGDANALNSLLDRYRARLRTLVTMRIGDMGARVDPSDVVQESLLTANERMADYLARRPVPFYLWLRQLTLERLIDLRRQHVLAKKRSVYREEPAVPALSDASVFQLVDRLIAPGSSPSQRVQRNDLRVHLRAAIDSLAEHDREVLVLRHLEQLTTSEIATLLDLTESAVKVRHLRALQRLRVQLGDRFKEYMP